MLDSFYVAIILAGSIFFTPAVAFLFGYAGSDLLDNIYKIILKKLTSA